MRNAVVGEIWFFSDLKLYQVSPGLWKSSLDFSGKTFVELAFVKAQQSSSFTMSEKANLVSTFAVKFQPSAQTETKVVIRIS